MTTKDVSEATSPPIRGICGHKASDIKASEVQLFRYDIQQNALPDRLDYFCLEVHCGPVGDKQDLDQEPLQADCKRTARQEANDEASDEDGSEEDDDEEERSRRSVREATEKPAVEEEIEEQTVVPEVDTPAVPEKKPSVLELLSSALDKAIAATQKIPTQQVASDAAGVFQILGQVFTEAIDKVIGDDDGPEETADKAPAMPAPVNEEPPKLDEPKEQTSPISESK